MYGSNRVFRGNVYLFLTGIQSESTFREVLKLYDFNEDEIDKIVEHLKKKRDGK